MSSRWRFRFLIALAVLAAGVIGFLAGRSSTPGGSAVSSPAGSGNSGHAPLGTRHDGTAPATADSKPPSQPGRGLPALPAASARHAGRESVRRMLDQPGPIARWRDLMAFAETASADEIIGAADELIDMEKGIDTIVARFFLYSRLGEEDPEAALVAIEGLPSGEVDLAKQSVLGGWAARDPEAAASYLLDRRDAEGKLDDLHSRLVRNVTDEWARIDPAKAFAWSLGLEGGGRRTGLEAVLRQWVMRSPADAAAAIAGFEEKGDRYEAYRVVAEHWARADYRTAVEWAEGLPDDVKSIATARTLAVLAEENPPLAAEKLESLPPGEDRDRTIRLAAANWSERDPAPAAEWILTQAKGENSNRAIRDIVRRWAQRDELAASEWLDRQPSGSGRDAGIVALSNHVVDDDPEAAAIWANAIGDPALRAIQVRGIIRNWMKSDRGAAFHWLQSTDVPDTLKAEFFPQ